MVGVHDYSRLNFIRLIPNPASDYFRLTGLEMGEEYFISVSDVSGRTILKKKLTGSEHTYINTSEIKAGIYFAHIVKNNSEIFLKLIISN